MRDRAVVASLDGAEDFNPFALHVPDGAPQAVAASLDGAEDFNTPWVLHTARAAIS